MTANTLKALPPDGFCKLEEETKGENRDGQDDLHSNADLLPKCAHKTATRPNQVFALSSCTSLHQLQFLLSSFK